MSKSEIKVRELFIGNSIVNFPCTVNGTSVDKSNHASNYNRSYTLIDYDGASSNMDGGQYGNSLTYHNTGNEGSGLWVEQKGVMGFWFYFPNYCESFTITFNLCPCSASSKGSVGCGTVIILNNKWIHRGNGNIYYNNTEKNPQKNKLVKSYTRNAWKSTTIVVKRNSPISFDGKTSCDASQFVTASWPTEQGFSRFDVDFSCGGDDFKNLHQHCGVKNITVSDFGNQYFYFDGNPNNTKQLISLSDNTTLFKAFEFN